LVEWLESLRAPLLQSDALEKADLIFVLAGHRNRKIYAARLFREGWAPRVLMSTGNPSYIARVLQAELAPTNLLPEPLRTSLQQAAATPSPRKGQFFTFLDREVWSVERIPVGWFGTLSEIQALGRWLQRHPSTRSLLIVSSGLHLRRLRVCCRQLLPPDCKTRFIAVPAEEVNLSMQGRLPEAQGARRILSEWAKLILYRFVLIFQRRSSDPAK
jgi:hypothetical protein